jgi:hypothetical protein
MITGVPKRHDTAGTRLKRDHNRTAFQRVSLWIALSLATAAVNVMVWRL